MNWYETVKAKIMTAEEAATKVRAWQNAGDKVVFSNGCFDILHRGHVEYLAKAASLGSRMVLGLNTDASVRGLKGSGRPVNDEYARAILIAGMGFIDAVVLFGEPTPFELISTVQPDILVKGDDYIPENIVGYDVVKARGGEILTIELTEGYSTTALIDRIKGAY